MRRNLDEIRLMAVHLVGVPRKTAKSEILRGYHIPKGSIIVLNAW